MVDYQLGKIYTVRSLTSPEIYVGSTCMILCKRMAKHRSQWRKGLVLGRNKEIVSDINEWYIELYENYPCDKIEELTAREGLIIRELGTLNKRIEGRTRKEYYIDNADKFKEYNKEYYIENIDKRKEQMKQNYIDNADKIKEYNKEYYIENIDKRKEQQKQNYIDNIDKRKEQQKQNYIDNIDKRKEKNKEYYIKKKLIRSRTD